MRMILSDLAILKQDGEMLPLWFYGLAYRRFDTMTSVFYPIPINYLLRIARTLSIWWNRLRGKQSWFDRAIVRAGLKERNYGIRLGERNKEYELRNELEPIYDALRKSDVRAVELAGEFLYKHKHRLSQGLR